MALNLTQWRWRNVELSLTKQTALRLMNEHGLDGWKFSFDNSKLRFGLCNFRKRTIYLSNTLTKLNDEKTVTDTILHEIAHALVGPGKGHGHVWRNKASTIGCTPERCYGDDVITPKRPYIGTCPSCNRKIRRFRRKKIACGVCCRANGGRFFVVYLFKWEVSK